MMRAERKLTERKGGIDYGYCTAAGPSEVDQGGAATYAITKLAGWKLSIPGFPGVEWNWGDGDGGGKGGFEDHSIPGDNSKGYFMYAAKV